MFADTLTRVSWRTRPRSFVALMALYESNFIRLGWLGGDLGRLAGTHRSQVEGDCDLLLSVTDRSPYTSIVRLTYLIPAAQGPMKCPDMHLRIYHDVRLVEAAGWAGRPGTSAPKVPVSLAERELDQRWARNMMLNKWLEYCAERGHRFSAST